MKRIVMIGASLLSLMVGAAPLEGSRPNIILVMTDDQGMGDLACMGNKVLKTPHLDRFHEQSTRFTDFQVSPTCAPTRSAIMSGRAPFKNGVTHTILQRERMALDTFTLAQALKSAGYETGIFGKWHLGDEEAYLPGSRGFNEVLIHGAGGIGQVSLGDFPPNKENLYFDNVLLHNDTIVQTKGFCTDLFFEAALAWIKKQHEANLSYFAYLAPNAPHAPLIAPEKYKERFITLGYDEGTASRYGMIENIDDNFGLLMKKLDEWNALDNTLVIFMTCRDLDVLTLADAMKQNGYRTGHSGKWHVGLTAASYGFEVVDEDRGIHRGMEDRTRDFAAEKDPKYPLSKEKYPPFSQKKPEGISYPYDQVTESAIKFMKESNDQPFFLNLCHWMVHWPVLTRNGELLEYYCDKMGHPFPPKPGAMTLEGQQNPYFAAMVTSVDWSLGRVVDFLKKTDDPRNPGKKLIETTYIFFTSDNGGAEIKGREIISDNYPLKYGKKHTEEGGIRIPLVIAGAGISPASQFDGLVNQLDFFPTILALTGSKIPAEDQQKLNGLDISPVLTGRSKKIVDSAGNDRTHLFWHFPHNGMESMKSAIRSGDFKLYKRYATDSYELYRLYQDGRRNDLEEQHDLAENPEFSSVVKSMAETLDAALVANDAKGPYLNPDYGEKTLSSVEIASVDFAPATRKATLKLASGSTGVREAYIIYRRINGSWGEENKMFRNKEPVDPAVVEFGVKVPASISEDGRILTADVPSAAPAFFFLILDENNYQVVSKIIEAK